MFILRAAFWLTLVILVLPGDPDSRESPAATAIDALIAARGAIADLSSMCERQPVVCANGGAALQSFGAKARNGAAILYETVGSRETTAPAAAPEATAVAAPQAEPPIVPVPAKRAGKTKVPAPDGTLSENDAKPRWRNPAHGGGKA